ncbi:substrate-binding domain-containing protein [Paenibacillus guangzhouensis]|uniref:substrate-binding domain-containing protein n=1 Tax=Paenibacillus guangzhouensis TaxID=1473112 RepID=UPI00126739EF|nr:substrate-binding domain-containing protein [Paenibacillus guangzhouensis]
MSNKGWTMAFVGVLLVFGYFLYKFMSPALEINHLVQDMNLSSVKRESMKHVVLIAQELDNPFWRTVEQGARASAAQRGIAIEYMGPNRINPSEQKRLLEKAITGKPDAILLQGVKDPDYASLIDQAVDQGIPVITVDADQPDSKRLAYVGTDNLEAGRRMGELIVSHAAGQGKIGVIIGSETADNQQLRLEGLRSVISKTQGYEIVAVRASNISRMQAATQTEALLSQYGDMKTMVGLSALDAAGIVEGMRAANRTGLRVFGFDDIDATVQGIASGVITASIVQHPREIGERSIELLEAYFKGTAPTAQRFIATRVLDRNHLASKVNS